VIPCLKFKICQPKELSIPKSATVKPAYKGHTRDWATVPFMYMRRHRNRRQL